MVERSVILFCIWCFSPNTTISQTEIDHWESVVLDGSIWSYLVPSAQPDATWIQPDYDDSLWPEGISGFGYGDGDDNTIIEQTMSVFIRHQFEIDDLSVIDNALFYMDYDDGFVAYMNGVEIARGNAGEQGEFIAWNQDLEIDHEAQLYSGGTPEEYFFDYENLLWQGTNTIAIEIHNVNTTSSDLTARPFMMIGSYVEEYIYNETPSWFVPPVNSCFNPNYIVVLNTSDWSNEVSWAIETFEGEIVAESNGGYIDYQQFQEYICLDSTCYKFLMIDSYGDGWNGANFELQNIEGVTILSGELENGSSDVLIFNLGDDCEIEGCTDPDAINFLSYANVDDGSCVSGSESNLPLILISTQESIPDDPRIIGNMAIINNLDSSNHITDPPNEYDGQISIEIRGSSSQMFPKKSYALETQDSLGENNNVPLLGMPQENDWILHGPYTDKTLMRNSIVFHLGQMVNRYTVRSRYCELFINEVYMGAYMMMENIKRDVNRVDIAKLLPSDTIGDELTGGYILKIDKFTGDFEGGWESQYNTIGQDGEGLYIQFHKPEIDELNEPQLEYIYNHITEFEDALAGEDFADSTLGYLPYIDVRSFVDLYLINELSKNIDGYRLSTYFYKEKDSDGGKIVMGPWWDYNLSLGNADYCDGVITSGFEVNTECGNENPFWFERLLEDENYSNLTRCVWEDYRSDEWSNENIHSLIDSLEVVLVDASVRDHIRWPRLGQYVWPNAFVGETYEEEIEFIRNWIDDRLNWLDNNITGICIPGCTDESACNFDSNAVFDDGSCEPCSCLGDFDYDGVISVSDVLYALTDFGCIENCSADLTIDGIVNIYDILEILSLFGNDCQS